MINTGYPQALCVAVVTSITASCGGYMLYSSVLFLRKINSVTGRFLLVAYSTKEAVQGAAIKIPHCAKCIIVADVLNFPVKFSGTVPKIVNRLQY